ncbi:hypothetical protein GVAV_000219 [Gurleya vavrai]
MNIRTKTKLLIFFIVYLASIPITYLIIKLSLRYLVSDSYFDLALQNYINRISQYLSKNNFGKNVYFYLYSFTFLPVYTIEIDEEKSIFGFFRKNENLVIKRVLGETDEDIKSKDLDHKNIVKIYKTFRTKFNNIEYVWLIMEKLDFDITFDYVNKNSLIIKNIVKDIGLALKYLHDRNIAHLDVKLENIMAKKTKEGVVYKLIDFGYSQKIENKVLLLENLNYGTFPYKPPEIVLKSTHTLKSDIWALGTSVYYLIISNFLFFDKYGEFQLKEYIKFLKNDELKVPEDADEEIVNFVLFCLIFDYKKRPNIDDVLSFFD